MLRILHVVTHMNRGGLETMLMNYYRHIDRTQVQFDFLTHRDYDGDYGEEIKALGGIIYHLPTLNPFSLSYKKTLGMFFKEHPEYQVIHVHQDCLSSVILKVAKEYGVRVRIAHSHCSSQDKDLKYPIKIFYRHFISKYATDLFACGKDAGNWMFCGAPFKVLNNAINSADYIYDFEKRQTVRKQLGLNNDELVIGHVGRFSPPKNHTYLIDIFHQIKSQFPNSKLLLIGDDRGELADNIKHKVADIGLSDSVIFTGLRSDVADLMQAMDVFLFPSLFEGFGIVALEAQAAGIPTIVSNRIPSECFVTDLIKSVELLNDSTKWSSVVLEAAKIQRKNTFEEIKNAGFDIKENALRLQDFYIKVSCGGE